MNKFESVFRLLMSKKVICEYASPIEYTYLSDTRNRSDMNQYLSRISMTTVETQDGLGFYCGCENIDNTRKKNEVLKDFEVFSQTMEGIIAWLKLARNIDSDSRPIMAGGKLSESELLAAIEESNSLQNQLDHIAHKLKRAHKSKESKTKLRSILDYLVQEGYFVSPSSTGSLFIATAKWSLLYETLEFIAINEGMLEREADGGNELDSQMELI
ncbi:condensin complex protein MksE [Photobacterium leiognathi]|uniref:condensin complex protein MksE n=1 Tax=Photobacterium leiognathi TaxID=553611 RepID=UPI00298117EC|nr:hypothetical protein [Photobacterium leiognathi]